MNAIARVFTKLPRATLRNKKRYEILPSSTLRPVPIRQLHTTRVAMSPVKRKAEKPVSPPKTKKAKVVIPEYHLTPSNQDESGEIIWPARVEQIDRARHIIKQW
jgi:hypothetical protein